MSWRSYHHLSYGLCYQQLQLQMCCSKTDPGVSFHANIIMVKNLANFSCTTTSLIQVFKTASYLAQPALWNTHLFHTWECQQWWRLEHSVEMSASYFSEIKLVTDNFSLYLCLFRLSFPLDCPSHLYILVIVLISCIWTHDGRSPPLCNSYNV